MIAANTFLPDGEHDPGEAFRNWRDFSQTVPQFPVSMIIQGATTTELPAAVLAAYDAPFPEERYKAGARQFPALVPDRPDAPGAADLAALRRRRRAVLASLASPRRAK